MRLSSPVLPYGRALATHPKRSIDLTYDAERDEKSILKSFLAGHAALETPFLRTFLVMAGCYGSPQ